MCLVGAYKRLSLNVYFFADGIVLIEESREEIKSKLALETDIGIKGLSLELE